MFFLLKTVGKGDPCTKTNTRNEINIRLKFGEVVYLNWLLFNGKGTTIKRGLESSMSELQLITN